MSRRAAARETGKAFGHALFAQTYRHLHRVRCADLFSIDATEAEADSAAGAETEIEFQFPVVAYARARRGSGPGLKSVGFNEYVCVRTRVSISEDNETGVRVRIRNGPIENIETTTLSPRVLVGEDFEFFEKSGDTPFVLICSALRPYTAIDSRTRSIVRDYTCFRCYRRKACVCVSCERARRARSWINSPSIPADTRKIWAIAILWKDPPASVAQGPDTPDPPRSKSTLQNRYALLRRSAPSRE